MTYEPQEREVVHPGQCQSLLIAHRVMKGGGMMFGNFETISRKDALALAKEGKLSERCLEKRLST